jgi:plasmid maintenance system antidote protein VapI
MCAGARNAKRSGKMRESAKVWPVGHFLKEEIKSRGWTIQDVTLMMDDPVSQLAFGLLINCPTKGMIIGKKMANELAHIFGTSKKYWINLDAAWQRN